MKTHPLFPNIEIENGRIDGVILPPDLHPSLFPSLLVDSLEDLDYLFVESDDYGVKISVVLKYGWSTYAWEEVCGKIGEDLIDFIKA